MSGYLFLMWLCLRLLTGHSNGELVLRDAYFLFRKSLLYNCKPLVQIFNFLMLDDVFDNILASKPLEPVVFVV